LPQESDLSQPSDVTHLLVPLQLLLSPHWFSISQLLFTVHSFFVWQRSLLHESSTLHSLSVLQPSVEEQSSDLLQSLELPVQVSVLQESSVWQTLVPLQ
jgi:hypothetical protein